MKVTNPIFETFEKPMKYIFQFELFNVRYFGPTKIKKPEWRTKYIKWMRKNVKRDNYKIITNDDRRGTVHITILFHKDVDFVAFNLRFKS